MNEPLAPYYKSLLIDLFIMDSITHLNDEPHAPPSVVIHKAIGEPLLDFDVTTTPEIIQQKLDDLKKDGAIKYESRTGHTHDEPVLTNVGTERLRDYRTKLAAKGVNIEDSYASHKLDPRRVAGYRNTLEEMGLAVFDEPSQILRLTPSGVRAVEALGGLGLTVKHGSVPLPNK